MKNEMFNKTGETLNVSTTQDSITVPAQTKSLTKRKRTGFTKSPANKIVIKNQWMQPSESLRVLDRVSDLRSNNENIRTKNLSPKIDLEALKRGSFFIQQSVRGRQDQSPSSIADDAYS